MKYATILLSLLLVSCAGGPAQVRMEYPQAQNLIAQTLAKYPDLVRLTIHAVPKGQSGSRIIACNLSEKIGKASDPEDLAAMKTNRLVVLREGNNVDVTAALVDRTGKPIAATGITLKIPAGVNMATQVELAREIAGEMSAAIAGSKAPMW